MSGCKHLGYCYLTSDEAGFSPDFARAIRTTYCRGDYIACARYQMAEALGTDVVPGDLFPAELDRVRAALSS
ncbi:MAG: hypothetical protein ACYC77_02820 [Coriobacteriia bacterium]